MFGRLSRALSIPHRHSFLSTIPFILKPSYNFQRTEEFLALLVQQKSVPLFPSTIRQIHAQLTVTGLQDGILATRVLGMYLMSQNYDDAQKLFCRLHLRYAAPWNWMIRGFTVMGYSETAVLFYFKMLAFGTLPDKYTFPYVIKACGCLQAVDLLKYVHAMIRDFNFELDVYVGSALVKFYSENNCLRNAGELFDRMPQRDIVLWNVMLDAYCKCEDLDSAFGLFQEMRRGEVEPNYVTYACVLSSCGSKSWLRLGTQFHGLVLRCGLDLDSAVANTLVAMYAKCGCVFYSRKVFDFIDQADLVTWNAMISGFFQNGFTEDALNFFQKMISRTNAKPDSTTFSSLLPCVSEFEGLNQGKEIHGFIIRLGVVMDLCLKNALIDMYFKCKYPNMACKVFNQSSAADVVIFTAMISGFVLNGMNAEALKFFRLMVDTKMKPNSVTLASVLPACAALATLKLGKELHGTIIRRGFDQKCYVGSALSDMYGKCGDLKLCHDVFLRIPDRDSICWNSIITNFCQSGKPLDAMYLFRCMHFEGATYDCVSISGALSACGSLCSLHHGKEIHGFMVRGGYKFDIFSNSALIDMYAKCGSLDTAHRVFDAMEHKNEVSWNSIIAAYGNYGHLNQCLKLFHEMQNHGFQPDHVTFLTIISACGHAGQVEQGKKYFSSMVQDHGIDPRMEHYACLIDLLGRAGRLEEAFEVTKSMPFSPDAGIWGTILGSCRIHGDPELAQVASGHLVELDPENSGYYVLLSNLHADSGSWIRVDQIREVMKERGVEKIRGESWIEVDRFANVFGSGDKCHPESCRVFEALDSLVLELQDEGDAAKLHTLISLLSS